MIISDVYNKGLNILKLYFINILIIIYCTRRVPIYLKKRVGSVSLELSTTKMVKMWDS